MKQELISALTELLPPGRVIVDGPEVDRLSKDFFWYSPVLEKLLKDKSAEVAVRPSSREEISTVISFACLNQIPMSVRGAGTGNYGQCIPLKGGILLDLGGMDRSIQITTQGTAICEPGVRLVAIEEAARAAGWELRCYPSTYVKASVGGFLAGGSGGIGSITYGALRDNETVRSITIMTMEASPREVKLTGNDLFKSLHAWGTTGIIVEVEIALGPKKDWAQIAVSFDDWDSCFTYCETMARDESFSKRLVTCFEWPIPSYFTPLLKWVSPGKALAFFEVADSELERFKGTVEKSGGSISLSVPYAPGRRRVQLSDYTWNHTTLWALKFDPSLTYLQLGFLPDKVRDQFKALKAKFGDEIIWHVEFVKSAGVVTPGSLPVVRFTNEARLQEMIDFCATIEVGVANPHINYLQGSGRWRPDDAKVTAKREFDPNGLLNPGKMLGLQSEAEMVAKKD